MYSQNDTPTVGTQAESATAETEPEAESASEAQVLEFKLGSERYCVDIDFVSEIVDRESLTHVPNAPYYVDGVMDLRGRTTSIVNPKAMLDIDDAAEGKRIVIFDPATFEDDAAVGWVVDEVFQVVRVSTDDVEEPPLDGDGPIEGIIKREDSLVMWISPTDAVR